MNYDSSQAKKLLSNIPQFRLTFNKLITLEGRRRKYANHFTFFFTFGCGLFFVATYLNMNLVGVNDDYVHEFRVRPDFLTGKRYIAYRKQSKQFVFY
jgi:hypothetical protein